MSIARLQAYLRWSAQQIAETIPLPPFTLFLRSAGGSVQVRDQEEVDHVRAAWAMPDDIAVQAEATRERVRALVELGAEPFGEVGRAWSRFVAEAGTTRP